MKHAKERTRRLRAEQAQVEINRICMAAAQDSNFRELLKEGIVVENK